MGAAQQVGDLTDEVAAFVGRGYAATQVKTEKRGGPGRVALKKTGSSIRKRAGAGGCKLEACKGRDAQRA